MNTKPSFWKTTLDEQSAIFNSVKKGNVRSIAKSPGNRDVLIAEYGEKQDFNRTANYSSSCGAGNTKYYADKTGKKPVIFIIGAIHATELEGTSALLNLVQMIETGEDFLGTRNRFLSECINQCRLLIVPLANPDGRARNMPDTMHGFSYEEHRHYTEGRWKDGTLCEWPECKAVHPIKDHVSFLGAYFNDDGINMMHDNFFGKMANETMALLAAAEQEAPDFTILLHGGGNMKPAILDTAHVPLYVKERLRALSLRIKEEANKQNLPYTETKIERDDSFPPRSFNLCSALHHVCGSAAFTYESNQGLQYNSDHKWNEWETVLSYEEILAEHNILFEQTIKYALELI